MSNQTNDNTLLAVKSVSLKSCVLYNSVFDLLFIVCYGRTIQSVLFLIDVVKKTRTFRNIVTVIKIFTINVRESFPWSNGYSVDIQNSMSQLFQGEKENS